MNDNLQNALALLITVFARLPLAIVIGLVVAFVVGFVASKRYQIKWWIQRKRLILRHYDRYGNPNLDPDALPTVRRWNERKWAGEWVFYKYQDELTWFERNILLDRKY